LDALAALQEKAAIVGKLVELEPTSPGKYQADASVDLVVENGTSRYLVECKTLLDRKGQIDQVRRQLDSTGSRGLLIAPYLTRELAEHCRATGLQFIDTCGNAYLHAPGLFVLITGEKGERRNQSFHAPKGLTNAAGLRVVFALLSKPELINSAFKDIASNAGVSLGTAHNVLDDLERRGYLINRGRSERRKLLEPRRLIDEWVINYPTALRAKLHGRRFSAPDPDWWQSFDVDEFEFAWGAEVAARKMTGYLKPSTQTLYVAPTAMESAISTLVKRYRIRPDPDGEIEILEKFWHWRLKTMPDIAPPLLVYSELLAILDPRTQETANMIKERFIDPAFDQG
jgi:hypothetical protein